MSMESDLDMINEYKASNDMEIVGRLYNRYIHLVYGVCLKYLSNRDDAQDAVMQIFEKLVSDLKKYEVSNFKSWLHVSAKNYCLMQLRSKKGKLNVPADETLMNNSMEFAIPMHHEVEPYSLELEHLDPCLDKLPSEQKKCVRLFYLEQCSYKEVAEKTGFEMKKVKSYIQNGKRNIKICIESRSE